MTDAPARTPPADVTMPLATGDDLPLPVRLQQETDSPATITATTRADGTREFLDVAFARLGGYRPLLLDLTIPLSDRPVPVVVYVHGGGFLWGTHRGTLFGFGDAALTADLAVASVQYRLEGEAPFPASLRDVASAIRWLKHFGPALGLDAEQVGVVGESAGGFLAVFAGMNTGDPELDGVGGIVGPDASVQAVVGWYSATESALPDDPEDARRHWASPRSHVSSGAAPMLLLHGDADREVPLEHSEILARALAAAGAEVELVAVPGAGHVFTGIDPSPVVARTVAFLSERLGTGA